MKLSQEYTGRNFYKKINKADFSTVYLLAWGPMRVYSGLIVGGPTTRNEQVEQLKAFRAMVRKLKEANSR